MALGQPANGRKHWSARHSSRQEAGTGRPTIVILRICILVAYRCHLWLAKLMRFTRIYNTSLAQMLVVVCPGSAFEQLLFDLLLHGQES